MSQGSDHHSVFSGQQVRPYLLLTNVNLSLIIPNPSYSLLKREMLQAIGPQMYIPATSSTQFSILESEHQSLHNSLRQNLTVPSMRTANLQAKSQTFSPRVIEQTFSTLNLSKANQPPADLAHDTTPKGTREINFPQFDISKFDEKEEKASLSNSNRRDRMRPEALYPVKTEVLNFKEELLSPSGSWKNTHKKKKHRKRGSKKSDSGQSSKSSRSGSSCGAKSEEDEATKQYAELKGQIV